MFHLNRRSCIVQYVSTGRRKLYKVECFILMCLHNSLLTRWKFTSCPPIPLISQSPYNCPHPSAACSPPKKKLIKNKTNKKTHLTLSSFQDLFIHPIGIRSCVVSHSVPFFPTSPTHKMFIAMSNPVCFKACGLPSLMAFIETPLGYSAVALSHARP